MRSAGQADGRIDPKAAEIAALQGGHRHGALRRIGRARMVRPRAGRALRHRDGHDGARLGRCVRLAQRPPAAVAGGCGAPPAAREEGAGRPPGGRAGATRRSRPSCRGACGRCSWRWCCGLRRALRRCRSAKSCAAAVARATAGSAPSRLDPAPRRRRRPAACHPARFASEAPTASAPGTGPRCKIDAARDEHGHAGRASRGDARGRVLDRERRGGRQLEPLEGLRCRLADPASCGAPPARSRSPRMPTPRRLPDAGRAGRRH